MTTVTPVNLSKEHLSNLWIKLTAIYGQMFINKHGVEDKGVWFTALKDLTPKALESGVERLMNLSRGDKFCEFPPNCLQFRALCLGFYEELRLPSAAQAYREAINGKYISQPNWSHPAVYYTVKKIAKHFMELESDAQGYALFKETYERVCHLVRQGHPLPPIKEPVLLSKPKSREVAANHLSKMRQLLGATQ